MNNVRALIAAYRPACEQEERDREQMLTFMDANSGWLTRENTMAHVTASAWVVDASRSKVLMAYHNIYRSWSWVGGHADGESDLSAVALREAQEETGIVPRLVVPQPVSIESLCVNSHIKKGRFVASHIHMNVTYLLEADPATPLQSRPGENSAVRWFSPEDAVAASTEVWIRERIYQKLNERLPK